MSSVRWLFLRRFGVACFELGVVLWACLCAAVSVLGAAWRAGLASRGAGARDRAASTKVAMEAFKRIRVSGGAERQSIFYLMRGLELV